MKILPLLLLASLISARKLIPLTKEKIDYLRETGLEVDEDTMEVVYDELPTGLPEEFDAREKWPQCIGTMPDEGKCNASLPLAVSSAITDQFCIAANKTNQTHNFAFSSQYLVSCFQKDGCKGQYNITSIYEYVEKHGLPSQDCVPYSSAGGDPGVCSNDKCTNPNHQTFELKKCKKIHILSDPYAIRQELFTYGPLACRFHRHLDFDDYKSGIYYRVESSINNPMEDDRGAKLIGWGVENGIEFWMLMNSWGDKWGENGCFRIRQNEVDICKIAGTCDF